MSRRGARPAGLALAALLPLVASASPARPALDEGDPPPRWSYALDWLRAQSDELAADLDAARERLLARADDEAPELAAKLRGAPPAKVERGYGVLPRLLDDVPPSPVEPRRRVYSLERVSTSYAWAMRDGDVLARRAAALAEAPRDASGTGEPAPLAELVADLERLRSSHANLEEHIAYHAYWQAQVELFPDFFAERNALLARIDAWNEARAGEPSGPSDGPRPDWMDELAPFQPTPGLRVEARGDALVLPVTITTDVDDEAFLAAFRAAVDDAYNACEPARELGFRVELSFEPVEPAALYPPGDGDAPRGPPARGAPIDEAAHCARFPRGALILTTGGASTHSFAGRAIVLGSDPLARRALAHEFGHLLGFTDAYLRGFEGDPAGPFGVVFVEWWGLQQDLMGDAGRGRVSRDMIARLIEAYRG